MVKRYSHQEIKHKIIEALEDIDTGLSGIEMAKKIGVNRITLAKYLNILQTIGLVKKKEVGSVNVWHLAQGVTEFELPIDILEVHQRYLNAVLAHSEGEARRIIVNVLHSGLDPIELLSSVITPALNTAYELYKRGRITITESMFIGNLISESIDLIKFNSPRDDIKPNAFAVFMSAQGESATVNPKMISVAFYVKGWNSYFLGSVASETDLLFDIDLLKFLNKIWKTRRGLMILGISIMKKEHLRSTSETIKSIRSKLDKKMFILVEGDAIDIEDEQVNELGADLYVNNLDSVVQWAEELYKKSKQ